MSKKIDERVVEMQFDNKQFERNVSTTMSTLDKLKSKLKLDGASKGLENVQATANKVNFSVLSNAVESVGIKFNAMYTIADQALRNITTAAMNAGKQIVSAFTIDPIKTGFQEYETQINAVQTILANTQSKGTTLTDVNAALDELNKYADQTIYNFTEMTRNIGTFTAAGVDLDKSVTSIKGIANLAAVSGSNATQASTAMYQLSQALAAGKVSLMDWNSVVNAGMGGQLFQDALKRTATQMGTNVDALIEKYGSFRESLTQGQWLTAEVLTETLTQLSGAYTEADLIAQGYSAEQAKEITELAETAVNAATKVKTFTQLWDTLKEAAQSGWTQTWEILVGDFEEAKDLLTELSETFGGIIQQSSDARNNLLYDAMTSNWKKITDGITEAGLSAEDFQTKVTEIAKEQGIDVDSIVKEYGSLEKAFKNGALSSDLLNQALVKMTGTSEEIASKMTELRGEYKSNADILKALTDAGYEQADLQDLLTKDTQGQTIALNDLSDAQLTSIGYTAEQITSIRELAKYSELANGSLSEFIDNVAVQNGREMLIDALRVSLRSLISVCEAVGKAWREVFPPTTAEEVLGVVEAIRNFAMALRPSEETLDKLQRTFRGLFSVLSIAKQALTAILSPIGSLLGEIFGLSGGILDATAAFGDFLFSIDQSIKAGTLLSGSGDGMSKFLSKIADGVRYVIDGLGSMTGMFSSVGKGIANVFNWVLDVVSNVVGWIRENLTSFDIFAGLAGGGIFVVAKKLSGFIDDLKDSFEGFLDIFKGKGGGLGFREILDSVHSSLEAFQQGIKVAALVGIATAVMLLSSALRTISEIEPGKIVYSLAAIQAMVMILNGGFKSLTKTLNQFNSKGTIKASVAMVAMATAINILGDAMTKMAKLNLGELAKGLIGISVSMTALSLAIKKISGANITLRTSIAMLALAKACEMLSVAVAGFAGLSWDEIARGLTVMGGALLEFTVVMSVLGKTGGMGSILGATGMLIAAQALDEISENLQRLGSLSWNEIARGLTAMGGALAEFTASLSVISKVGGFGAVLGGTAILIAVQSLDEISENLKKLGSMTWDEIGKGLAAMGVALAEFTASLSVLSKIAGFGAILGGTALLIAVQSLDEIAENLERMGTLPWSMIGRGLTAMGVALAEFTASLSILSKVGGFGAILGGTALLIAVQSLDEISENLERLGSMSWDEIGRGLTAMGVALAEFTAALAVLSKVGGFGSILGGTAILIAVQSLDEISENLKRLGSMTWDEIGRGLAAMGGALIEVAGVSGALGKLAGISAIFGAGAIFIAVQGLEDLAVSFQKFGSMSWDEIGRGLVAMGGALAEIAVVEGVLGSLTNVFGVLGGASLALGMQGLEQVADALQKFGSMSWDEIGKGLSAMGGALGELALGGFLNTFAIIGNIAISEISVSLGDLADSVMKWKDVVVPEGLAVQLGSLAAGVNGFMFAGWASNAIDTVALPLGIMADSVKKWENVTVPNDIGTNLEALASGVKAFTFGGWGADALSTAAPGIGDMASAIKKWSDVTVPSDIEAGLTGIANGVKAFNFAFLGSWSMSDLAEPLGSLPDAVKKWNGVSLPENLETNLMSLADGVKAFSFAFVGGWSIGAVIEPLGSLADAVRKWDGVTITGIGPELTNLSTGLKDLVEVDIGSKFVDRFESLFDKFSGESMTTANSNIGMLITTLERMNSIDVNGISTFSTALTELGKVSVDGLVQSVQNGAVSVGDAITVLVTTMQTRLTDSSGTISSSATTLGTTIGKNVTTGVTTGLANLSISMSNAIYSATSAASSSVMSNVGSFQTVGTTMASNLASGFSSASDRLSALSGTIINSALSAFNGNATQFYSAGIQLITQFTNGITNSKINVTTVVTTILTETSNKITSYGVQFMQNGAYIMTQFISGAKNNNSGLSSAFTDVINSTITTINGYYQSFYNAGGYLVQGFADGITANSGSVAQKAAEMAQSAYNAAMKELDAHSPSKLFMKVGSYVALGFANGISENNKAVDYSAEEMAQTALNSTQKAISMLASAVDANIDTQPTIRPVLDLSDVESKAGRLNAMFSSNKAMSIGSKMNTTVSNGSEIQNGSSDQQPVPVVKFEQNNYSPKALSSIEIYRQTKNLFSTMERKVKA